MPKLRVVVPYDFEFDIEVPDGYTKEDVLNEVADTSGKMMAQTEDADWYIEEIETGRGIAIGKHGTAGTPGLAAKLKENGDETE